VLLLLLALLSPGPDSGEDMEAGDSGTGGKEFGDSGTGCKAPSDMASGGVVSGFVDSVASFDELGSAAEEERVEEEEAGRVNFRWRQGAGSSMRTGRAAA